MQVAKQKVAIAANAPWADTRSVCTTHTAIDKILADVDCFMVCQ